MKSQIPPEEQGAVLDRAQKALTALRYREQAALYHAAAASLEIAIKNAEQGLTADLDLWLEKNSPLIEGVGLSGVRISQQGLDRTDRTDRTDLAVQTDRTDRTDRTDQMDRTDQTDRTDLADQTEPDGSIWTAMAAAAEKRLAAQPAVQITPTSESSKTTKKFFARLDVIGSVVIHVAIVLVLAFIVIRQAAPPEKVAIVSAPLESDIALTETPLEEEIEPLEESTTPASMESPDLSSVADVSLPSVDVAVNVDGLVGSEASSSLANQMKSAMAGMSESKSMQGAAFFGLQATGNAFIYLVDNSPSMRRDGAFDNARNEMIRSLMSMKPKQKFHLIMFGKELQQLSFPGEGEIKSPVYATPENVKKAIDWLQTTTVQKDGWPPNEALKVAIAMDPDAIFMLFDGDTRADVPKFLRDVNRTNDIISDDVPKVPIHVIHFFEESFAKDMQKVAAENLGTYRFVPRPPKATAKGQQKN